MSLSPPQRPNGILTNYNLLVNGTRIQGSLALNQNINDLKPYSYYEVAVEACTEVGCNVGPPGYVTTKPALPIDQPKPSIIEVSNSETRLSWDPPLEPNGLVKKYDVIVRESCPVARQPIMPSCQTPTDDDSFLATTSGIGRSAVVGDLTPYTTYDVRIDVFNDEGKTGSDWLTFQTQSANSKYISPPVLTRGNQMSFSGIIMKIHS